MPPACPASVVASTGGPHRPRPGHERVGPVAGRAPPRDGRRARRRHPRPLLRDRLVDRARRTVPRRAQPTRCSARAARPRRRRDRRSCTRRRSYECVAGTHRTAGRARRRHGRRAGVSEHGAFAGKLLARPRRRRDRRRTARRSPEPRATGRSSTTIPDPERSLWWWHYNTSKRGVVLDLDIPTTARAVPRAGGRRRHRARGRAARRRWPTSASTTTTLRADHPELIWVSVTPFGRATLPGERARHRPHAARRRRPGLELRVRRPHAPPGARRWQPGVPHRQRVRGDERAHRAARSATCRDAASTST